MGLFAGALAGSANRTVVYPESHDEAGNAEHSERNILIAVNNAPLVGETRWYAEARMRCVTALSLLTAGTPMFLMGDEVGAQKAYTYNHFTENKEDLYGLRAGPGAGLFAAHRDLIGLRLGSPAAKSRNLEVLHTNDGGRVIAFRRWSDPTDDDQAGGGPTGGGPTGGGPARATVEEMLVVCSLNNQPFPSYLLRHPALTGAPWRLRLSTDDPAYNGRADAPTTGNFVVTADGDGTLDLRLPAVATLVFTRLAGATPA